ncbi:MAG: hypothetical protein HXX08_08810 [Chloroflexi bacterium]|uniref:Uncharacterized protein n=1 Tax=Candidatus Chlorohelix allophototropha TaxID=3003348 RepID=A0A8T7LY79_9CHLR|nr:hypothetical protein [Chloroflexota bacterium]WJW67824.1 hypothetical protein OZ401_001106 [Chloroflexota bacterium L227-S17]
MKLKHILPGLLLGLAFVAAFAFGVQAAGIGVSPTPTSAPTQVASKTTVAKPAKAATAGTTAAQPETVTTTELPIVTVNPEPVVADLYTEQPVQQYSTPEPVFNNPVVIVTEKVEESHQPVATTTETRETKETKSTDKPESNTTTPAPTTTKATSAPTSVAKTPEVKPTEKKEQEPTKKPATKEPEHKDDKEHD